MLTFILGGILKDSAPICTRPCPNRFDVPPPPAAKAPVAGRLHDDARAGRGRGLLCAARAAACGALDGFLNTDAASAATASASAATASASAAVTVGGGVAGLQGECGRGPMMRIPLYSAP